MTNRHCIHPDEFCDSRHWCTLVEPDFCIKALSREELKKKAEGYRKAQPAIRLLTIERTPDGVVIDRCMARVYRED